LLMRKCPSRVARPMSAKPIPKEKDNDARQERLQPLLPLTSTYNAARCLELLAELLNSVVVSDPTYISEDEY
jgi:hypothetical protein